MSELLDSAYLDILLETGRKLREKQTLLEEVFGESNAPFLDPLMDSILDGIADHLGFPPDDGLAGNPRDDAWMAWVDFTSGNLDAEEFKEILGDIHGGLA